MEKVGIITFHRVYNYGAVIQAYSIQCCLTELGCNSTIIDFSKPIQYDYTNIISVKHGIKRFVKGLMMTSLLNQRLLRKKRFDSFIVNDLHITSKMYDNERQLSELNKEFDAFICGSDQIWNPLKKSDFSTAYLLDFAKKKKIAYAPSIGNSNLLDIKKYIDFFNDFSSLSCRESGGAEIISKLTGRNISVVLDPTLLVDKKYLFKLTEEKNYRPYILYYTLDGNDNKNRNMGILEVFSKKYDLDVKIIAPEWPFHTKSFEDVVDAGPKEFLTLIRNATLICTNSFHGTALSIKFEKPFYVLEEINIKDERKRSILLQLGLEDRIISKVQTIDKINNYEINYEVVSEKLEKLRKQSWEYLEEAIRGI